MRIASCYLDALRGLIYCLFETVETTGSKSALHMGYSGFKIKKALGIVNKFPPVRRRGKTAHIALHNIEGVTLRALVP